MSTQTPPSREPAGSTLYRLAVWVLFAFGRLVSLLSDVFSYTRVRAGVRGTMVIVVTVAVIAVGMWVGPTTATAAPAHTVNFQARLQTASGAIVGDGFYNVRFRLYSGSTGGSALWTESYLVSASQGVRTANGYLTANLGSITAFPSSINWGQQLYLTMEIGGTGSSASWDGEMNPRLPLTSVPSAFALNSYNSANGYSSSLSILQPTVGNQTFQIQDQGAGGTYNLCVVGSDCGFAAETGGDGYIQNQNTAAQTGSNFWISGTGRAATALQAPAFDSIAAGNLNIGTTNATSITLGKAGVNTIVAGNLSVGTTSSYGAITIANGAWLTALDSAGTGFVNMLSLNSSNEIQVGAALNIDGGIILPTDGGQMTFSDLPISSGAVAGTAQSYTLRVGSSNALTVYGEANGSGSAQNIRVAIGSSISPEYTLDVGGTGRFTGRVVGVDAVNDDEFVTLGQLNSSGGGDYIVNGTSVQAGANFNIGGNGVIGGTLTVSGASRFATGSTSAPGISFSANNAIGLMTGTSVSGSDAVRAVANNVGAGFQIQNANAAGYSGIEYLNNAGTVSVFTGFNNGNNQEFRFNNIASGGFINFMTGGASRLNIANDGTVKATANNTGAGFQVQNANAAGYSGIEYLNNAGTVAVFSGFNNSNGQEFRFNNIASGGFINFMTGGGVRLQVTNAGGLVGNASSGNLLDLKLNDISMLTVDASGGLTMSGTLTVADSAVISGGFTLAASTGAGVLIADEDGVVTKLTGDSDQCLVGQGAGEAPIFGSCGSGLNGSGDENAIAKFDDEGNLTGSNLSDDGDTLTYTGANLLLGTGGVSPQATTIKAAAATGSNVTGGNLTIDASNGTGTGGSGDIILRTAAPTAGSGSPVVGTYTRGANPNANTLSFSHTVDAGSNRLLLVEIVVQSNGASVTSVDYGGQALTKLDSIGHPYNSNRVEMWYLLAPNVGSTTLTTNLSSYRGVQVVALNMTGVSQATPFGTASTAQGSSNTASTSVSASSLDTVVDVVATDTGAATAGGGQTSIWNAQQGVYGASSYKYGTGTVTTSWTTGSTLNWVIMAVPVQSSSSSSSANILTEGLRVTNQGRVGINASTPGAMLQAATNSAGTIGQILQGSAGQTADLLRLQDSAGNVNAAFNALGNQLTLGRIATVGTVTPGTLVFADGTTSGYGVTIVATALTANRTLTLPDEDGILCTTTTCGGGGLTVDGTVTDGTIAMFTSSGTQLTKTNLSETGATNTTLNYTGDFLIQNASAVDVFSVDSINKRVSVGAAITYSGGAGYTYGSGYAARADVAMFGFAQPAFADFDGDGDQDIARSDTAANSIAMRQNNGDATFASATTIASSMTSLGDMAAGDMDGDGDQDIAVVQGSNIAVLKNNGSGTFAAPAGYAAGGALSVLRMADVDNDGDQDVIGLRSGYLTILKNTGSGALAAASTYALSGLPTSIFIADVDNDGDKDIASANGPAYIFKNDGTGAFTTRDDYGSSATAVTLADLDADGDKDLIITAGYPSPHVRLNDGSGNFGSATTYSLLGNGFWHGAVGNLDGDANPDIAFTGMYMDYVGLGLVEGSGSGGVVDFASYPTDFYNGDGWTSTSDISLIDLDGDSDDEIIVSYTDGTIRVNKNNYILSGTPATTYGAALSLTTAGSDQAGIMLQGVSGQEADLLRIQGSDESIFMNIASNGNVGIGEVTGLESSSHALNVQGGAAIAGAFTLTDSAGTETLFTANTTDNRVVIGNATGTGANTTTLVLDSATTDPDGVDGAMYYKSDTHVFRCYIDGAWENCAGSGGGVTIDGSVDDGAFAKFTSSGTQVANSNLSETGSTNTTLNYTGSFLIQNASSVDVFSVDSINKQVSVGAALTYVGGTTPTYGSGFSSPLTYSLASGTMADVAVADFDNDGDLDIAGVDITNSTIVMRLNNGDNTFGTVTTVISVASLEGSIVAADLNGDGNQDLIAVRASNAYVLTNFGGASFGGAANYTIGSGPTGIYTADVDNDGDQDLLSLRPANNLFAVLKNNGNGTFATRENNSTITSPYGLAIADVNGDGYPDVAARQDYGSFEMHINNGSGVFPAGTNYVAASNTTDVDFADIDGDGDQDIIEQTYAATPGPATRLNNGSGVFGGYTANATFSGNAYRYADFGDLDGDGDPDLAAVGYVSSYATYWLRANNGSGGYMTNISGAPPQGYLVTPKTVHIEDTDGDTDNDLVYALQDGTFIIVTNNYINGVTVGTVSATTSITASAADKAGLVLQGAASQEADLFHIQAADGSALFNVASNGDVSVIGSLLVNPGSVFTGNLLDLQLNGSSKFSVSEAGNTIIGGTLSVVGATLLNGSLYTGSSTTSGNLRIDSVGNASNLTLPTASSIKIGAANAYGVPYVDNSNTLQFANVSGTNSYTKCLLSNGTNAIGFGTCPAGGGSGWSLTGDSAAGSVLGSNAGTTANFVISSRPGGVSATSSDASYISFSGNQYSNPNRIVISGDSNSNSPQGGGSWSASNTKDYFRIQDSTGAVAFAVQGAGGQQQVFVYLNQAGAVGVAGRVCSTLAANSAGMATLATCSNTGTDLAESYNSTQQLEEGEIVATDPSNYPNVLRSTEPSQDNLIGIVSTDPDYVMGEGKTPDGYPIALNGRVPTKVNGEGGAILPGDKITSSSVAGVGKKATGRGMIVGTALTGFNGSGEGVIEVFVHLDYYEPTTTDVLQTQSGTTLTLNGGLDIAEGLNVSGAATLQTLQVTGSATVGGNLTVQGTTSVTNIIVGKHVLSQSDTPTVVLGAAAGQDGEIAIDGTDVAGTLTVTVHARPQQGETPAENLSAGTLGDITFRTPYQFTPRIVISPTNQASVNAPVYLVKTTEGWQLMISQPATDGTVYQFDYVIVGSQGTSP